MPQKIAKYFQISQKQWTFPKSGHTESVMLKRIYLCKVLHYFVQNWNKSTPILFLQSSLLPIFLDVKVKVGSASSDSLQMTNPSQTVLNITVPTARV